jgi:hypothetical protein
MHSCLEKRGGAPRRAGRSGMGRCALRPSAPGEERTQRKPGWSRRRSATPGSVMCSETHKVWGGMLVGESFRSLEKI